MDNRQFGLFIFKRSNTNPSIHHLTVISNFKYSEKQQSHTTESNLDSLINCLSYIFEIMPEYDIYILAAKIKILFSSHNENKVAFKNSFSCYRKIISNRVKRSQPLAINITIFSNSFVFFFGWYPSFPMFIFSLVCVQSRISC